MNRVKFVSTPRSHVYALMVIFSLMFVPVSQTFAAETGPCEIGDNLLTNGSFEVDTVNDHEGTWEIFANPSSWLVSLSDGLELWAKGFYGNPSEGVQNAELDGNSSTMITQSVATIPGATYELKFDFSARPDASAAADNSIDALIDGTLLMNATADGSEIATINWSTYSKTFVAEHASTDISLKDIGTSNSYGSLVDNVVLCKVKDPEPRICTATFVSGIDEDEDGSDDATTVVEKDGALAKLISPISIRWTALIPDANWIWGDNPVAAPVDNVAQTFVRTFGWGGSSVTEAKLYIASDDSHTVTMNGDDVGGDAFPINFTAETQDEYDVTSFISNGNNMLSVNVLNHEYSTDATLNPAGLMYKLVVTGTGENCDVPYVEDTEYQLDITTTGDGEGDITSGVEGIQCYTETSEGEEQGNDCSETYPAGTEVTLVATPHEGSNFNSSWIVGAGTCTGNTTPCTVTMNSNLSLTAHFARNAVVTTHHVSSGRHSSKSTTGEVLGDSITKEADEGEVLGATIDIPVGAPDTGAGGTSPVVITLPTLSAILNRKVSVHNAK